MKFLKILVLLLFAGILSKGQEADVESLLAVASVNIKNEKYDVALSMIKEALYHEPDNITALQMQINIYYLTDDLKEAGSLAESAIEKYPQENEFLYLGGQINTKRGKYEKAINDYDKMIELNTFPDMYKVYLNRGVDYMSIQQYERAAEDFSRSIELNSNNAAAYHSRGMMNYQLRDYTAAVKDFKNALLINNDNPETHFNLGMSYYRLDDRENACPHFHEACKRGNINACKMVLMECSRE